MTVSSLKSLLDSYPDDQEFSITIFTSDDDDDPIFTYDIGFDENEFGEFNLFVNGF
ncbi:MAG: hypothetical protein FWF12_11945 [Betaproteobacteria bacterium]|nr:hypothetical protein [Betaproteobacteria bacterium]